MSDTSFDSASAGAGIDLSQFYAVFFEEAGENLARMEQLLLKAEYKRRQAPPGVKITRRSFGRDRRYPLTNGFREN